MRFWGAYIGRHRLTFGGATLSAGLLVCASAVLSCGSSSAGTTEAASAGAGGASLGAGGASVGAGGASDAAGGAATVVGASGAGGLAPLPSGAIDEQVPYPAGSGDGGTVHARVAIDDDGNVVVAYSFGNAVVANYRARSGPVGAAVQLSSAGKFADVAVLNGQAMLAYQEADQAFWRASSATGLWQAPVKLGQSNSASLPRFAVGPNGVLACWQFNGEVGSQAYVTYATSPGGSFLPPVALGLPLGTGPEFNGTISLSGPRAVWLGNEVGLVVWSGSFDTTWQYYSAEWSGGALGAAIEAKGIWFNPTTQLVLAGPGEAALFGDQDSIAVSEYRSASGWTAGKGIASRGVLSDFVHLEGARYAVALNDVGSNFDLGPIEGGQVTELVRVSQKPAEAAFLAASGDGSAFVLWSSLRNDGTGIQYLESFYARYKHGIITELQQLKGKERRQTALAVAVNAAGRAALVWTDGAGAIAQLHLSIVDP